LSSSTTVKAKDHKTKAMAGAVQKLGFERPLSSIGGKEIDANFARATANLPKIDVLPVQGANVYDILQPRHAGADEGRGQRADRKIERVRHNGCEEKRKAKRQNGCTKSSVPRT
jgi:ribosomal protein L4